MPCPAGAPDDDDVTAAMTERGSADIVFRSPVLHARIVRARDNAELLVARGEAVFHPSEPGRFARIEDVGDDTVVLRTDTGEVRRIPARAPVPDLPGLVFTRTARLDHIHYRFRPVDRVDRLEPSLVAIEGGTAILEIQVPRRRTSVAHARGAPSATAPRHVLDAELLRRIPLRELRPGEYEVKRSDIQEVFEDARQVLTDLRPVVLPRVLLGSGVEYRIDSAAGDGVVSAEGFTVYSPKLASRAGIQLGDRILSVNGHPVDGLWSLYRIYQALREDPVLASIEVELNRAGRHLTRTYRIR